MRIFNDHPQAPFKVEYKAIHDRWLIKFRDDPSLKVYFQIKISGVVWNSGVEPECGRC